jgi:hypothetical protein
MDRYVTVRIHEGALCSRSCLPVQRGGGLEALSDTLLDLRPLLDRQSVAIWLTGVHTLARHELAQLGITEGANAIPLYDEVDEAISAFTSESGSS